MQQYQYVGMHTIGFKNCGQKSIVDSLDHQVCHDQILLQQSQSTYLHSTDLYKRIQLQLTQYILQYQNWRSNVHSFSRYLGPLVLLRIKLEFTHIITLVALYTNNLYKGDTINDADCIYVYKTENINLKGLWYL